MADDVARGLKLVPTAASAAVAMADTQGRTLVPEVVQCQHVFKV